MKIPRIGPTQVARKSVRVEYIRLMSKYLSIVKNIDIKDATTFVLSTMKARTATPMIRIIKTIRPGFIEEQTITTKELLEIISTNVLSPSGSVFHPSNVMVSDLSVMIGNFKRERKIEKNKMFVYRGIGEFEKAAVQNSIQNAIKVVLNSLPGSAGYEPSIHFDLGVYNAITSSGRILITNAFVVTESVLTANLAIYSIPEAVNLLMLIKDKDIDNNHMLEVMAKHDIPVVRKKDVLDYFNSYMQRYTIGATLEDHTEFNLILNSLSVGQVQFAYYHSNLKGLLMEPDNGTKDKITQLFDLNINTDNVEVVKLGSIDPEIMMIATTILSKEVDGRELRTIESDDPTLSMRLLAYCTRLVTFIESFDDLMAIFLFHDMGVPRITFKNVMQRDAVVVSDTDSVISTQQIWSEWFTGQSEGIVDGSFNISALISYWLGTAIDDTMSKFAISLGVLGEETRIIAMKGEYTYTVMLTYMVKKVYAAMIAAQEGVVYADLVPDLKGAAIRGIKASTISKKFIRHIIIDRVLTPCSKGLISAREIIEEVVEFENRISDSLDSASMDFAPNVSVKFAEDYAKPNSTSYFYLRAWNEIFPEYDALLPPDKLPLLSVIKPTKAYFAWLAKEHPETHDRFKAFIDKYKKVPVAFFIPESANGIPPALRPLIDVRDIIYYNVAPIYLTLEGVNIYTGNKDKKVLLKDIYGDGNAKG